MNTNNAKLAAAWDKVLTTARYENSLHMMEAQGGSFVRALAQCYYAADPVNREKLRAAFADYFANYEARFQAHRATA